MMQSLRDVEELLFDVRNGWHIPVRFRKAPFTDAIRLEYVAYLEEVASDLRHRLNLPPLYALPQS